MNRIIIAVCFVAITAIAGNSEYDPEWVVGDEWTVRTTFMEPGNPKLFYFELQSTNLVYPYSEIFDYEQVTVDYTYKVTSIITTNEAKLAYVSVIAPTNKEYGIFDWELVFNVDTMCLLMIDQLRDGASYDQWGNMIEGESWLTDSVGGMSIIHDFARIPTISTNQNSMIQDLNVSDRAVFQNVTFSSTNVVIEMKRTNRIDGLDHKATITWDKGSKWWSHALVELGTNKVVWSELITQ